MALKSLNYSKCYKVRSISFPARGQVQDHTITIAEELEKFQSWLAISPPLADTVCNGFEGLNQLYSTMKLLLTNSPQTLQALSNYQHEKWVAEMIEESMIYVDICSKVWDAVCQMSECTSELQSALRRRKGNEIDIESSVEAYISFRKIMKKGMEKSLLELKKMENKFGHLFFHKATNNHLLEVVCVLKGASLATNLMFQKLLPFVSTPIRKPKASRWSLAKLVTKGADSTQDCSKNEFEDVDIEVMNLPIRVNEDDLSINSALEKLESLDLSMKAFENGLESLFKNLVYLRVTYLNMCSQ